MKWVGWLMGLEPNLQGKQWVLTGNFSNEDGSIIPLPSHFLSLIYP